MEMKTLFGLEAVDLRGVLPRGPQAVARRLESAIKSETLHYNGLRTAIALTQAAEIVHLKSIAQYHLTKVWGYDKGRPIYGDGAMYHVAVGGTGRIYFLRDLADCLWHCGNAKGNNTSLAIHLPIGVGQRPTAVQWSSAVRVFDAAAEVFGFGRQGVVGHSEWPRSGGGQQSECPGYVLLPMLKAWRREPPAPAPAQLTNWRVRFDDAYIREAPSRQSPIAQGGHAVLDADDTFLSDGSTKGETLGGTDQWVHLNDGRGFMHISLLERIG